LKGQNIYFASDFHLGADSKEHTSKQREQIIVRWLDSIHPHCGVLYLVGDVFDFWFEYKSVIPQGYTRLFGKLCEMTDAGVEIHFFTGNHDMWVFNYFQNEIGMKVHYQEQIVHHFGAKIFVAHGDGLGPGDAGYKFTKKVFTNKFMQWSFQKLHPNFGLWLMKMLSSTSKHFDTTPLTIHEPEKEWMIIHSRTVLKSDKDINYFVFGHRHYPMTYDLGGNKKVVYLGDWYTNFTYAKLSEEGIELLKYEI
jgi:UDP-2,3-diacylglucosamine hydrolase